jgi:hypothetical protein
MLPERQSITSFLDWLRNGHLGFEASDYQYLAAQALVEAKLEDVTLKAVVLTSWKTLLAPALCSSETQQSEFYTLFDKWFKDNEPIFVAPTVPAKEEKKRRVNLDVFLYGLACLTALIIVGWLGHRLWLHRSGPPQVVSDAGTLAPIKPQDFNSVSIRVEYANLGVPRALVQYAGQSSRTDFQGNVTLPRFAAPTYLQVTAPGYRPVVIPFPQANSIFGLQLLEEIRVPGRGGIWLERHASRLRLLFMIPPLLVALAWLIKRWLSALELRRWASTVEPRIRGLTNSQNTEPLFRSRDMRKLATALRRRRPEEALDLDTSATVEKTCREGGFFSPVYAARTSEPEYLFVGERKNLRDQQARLQDELIGRLREHDVFVQRYYFQSDPSVCVDLKGAVYSLKELAVLHPNHGFWLAVESNSCIDEVSGEPKPWFGLLQQWRDRALLSFTVPRGPLEIPCTMPTRRGLENLVSHTISHVWQEPIPSLLRDNPERWIQRVEPIDGDGERLDIQLQLYLGQSGYLLLQACAVYPALAWNITLALADELLPPGEREDVLGRLAALPWFRHGTMPDWLRVRLLGQLGCNETKIRLALRSYLDQTEELTREKEKVLEIVPGKPHRDPGKLALRDHVYLSFASKKRLDQLSAEAPRKWQKFLRDSVWLRVGFIVLSLAISWIFLGKLLSELAQRLMSRQGKAIAIQIPTNPFNAELYTVAQALNSRVKIASSPTVKPDLILYSKIASNILNCTNPFPDETSLRQYARRVSKQELASGMIAEFGGRLELVEAIHAGSVRLFNSSIWRLPSDFGFTYDLSDMVMPAKMTSPVAQQNTGESGAHDQISQKQKQQAKSPTATGPAELAGNRGTANGVPTTTIAGEGQPRIADNVSITSSQLYQDAARQLAPGIGELHFGMPWEQVNKALNPPFNDAGYGNLPVAGEYAPVEVRYIWVRLSSIAAGTDFREYLSIMKPFEACMMDGSQSYVVFLFQMNHLIRISSRFFDDCPERERFFAEFVANLGLSVVLPPNARDTTFTIGSTNLTWSPSSGAAGLDIWKQGSSIPHWGADNLQINVVDSTFVTYAVTGSFQKGYRLAEGSKVTIETKSGLEVDADVTVVGPDKTAEKFTARPVYNIDRMWQWQNQGSFGGSLDFQDQQHTFVRYPGGYVLTNSAYWTPALGHNITSSDTVLFPIKASNTYP